jgi:hypothetical protein
MSARQDSNESLFRMQHDWSKYEEGTDEHFSCFQMKLLCLRLGSSDLIDKRRGWRLEMQAAAGGRYAEDPARSLTKRSFSYNVTRTVSQTRRQTAKVAGPCAHEHIGYSPTIRERTAGQIYRDCPINVCLCDARCGPSGTGNLISHQQVCCATIEGKCRPEF